MITKAAVALILGLVFQLSLVLPGLATPAHPAPASQLCDCCAGSTSCPCADDGEPDQRPLPLAPEAGQSVKVPLAKATGTRVSMETVSGPQASAKVVATPTTGHFTGYTGLRLSVAFCSFVM